MMNFSDRKMNKQKESMRASEKNEKNKINGWGTATQTEEEEEMKKKKLSWTITYLYFH